MSERAPALVLCAHGTRDPAGAATVRRIARKVSRARPELDVIRAYVDVQLPDIGDLTASMESAGRACIVVPLLLGTGYHVQVDIDSAVRRHGAAAAAPLGPDPALADLLVTRLREAGAVDGDGVVLAAAGSSRAAAADDAEEARALLAARWPGPVAVGYGASARPRVPDAVRQLRTAAPRVAVAAYLIGRGHFHDRLREAGADLVTAPLGCDDAIAQLVLRRYDAARSRTAPLSSPAAATATRTINKA